MADPSNLSGLQSAGLALSNFADAAAMMSGRPGGYANQQLQQLQNLQRQLLMTQQLQAANDKKNAISQISGGPDSSGITWNTGRQPASGATQTLDQPPTAQAGLAADGTPQGAGLAGEVFQPPAPTFTPGQMTPAQMQASNADFSADQMASLKRAFPEQFAAAQINQLTEKPVFSPLKEGEKAGYFDPRTNTWTPAKDAQGNPIEAPSKADDELINVVRTDQPNAKPQLMSKKSFNALNTAQPNVWAKAGDISVMPKVTTRQMTPAELEQWHLAPGTVASIDSNGKPEVVSKASGQDYLAAIPPNLQGDDALGWVKTNLPGGNEVASMVQEIVDGKRISLPPMGRPGAMGEKVQGLLAITHPEIAESDIKNRYQMSQELTSQKPGTLGDKLNSVSAVVNHSVGLLDSALALNNGSLTPINSLANVGKSLTSSEPLRAFKKNQEGLGNEFEKLSGGGVAGQQARAEASDSYSASDGITGTLGSVGKTIEMMEGRVSPVVSNYNRVYNTNYTTTDFIRNVLKQPQTADKLEGMQAIVNTYKQTGQVDAAALAALTGRKAPAGGAGTPGQQAVTINDIPAPAQRVAGQTYPTPQGPMKWTGTGWVK